MEALNEGIFGKKCNGVKTETSNPLWIKISEGHRLTLNPASFLRAFKGVNQGININYGIEKCNSFHLFWHFVDFILAFGKFWGLQNFSFIEYVI